MSIVEPSDTSAPSDELLQYLGSTDTLVEGEVDTPVVPKSPTPVDEGYEWWSRHS